MFNPGPIVYMHKLAVGPEAVDVIDIEAPAKVNLKKIAKVLGKEMEDLTVVILDRPRHEGLIQDVRQCGARIRLLPDGDVAGALMTSWPDSHIDVLMGIGGTPEGVLAACALKCMGGTIQGKLFARNEEEAKKAVDMGYDLNRVLSIDDLVSSDDLFFAATGITNGDLVRGVDYFPGGARTHSLVMRGLTGTVREIIATHRLDRLEKISRVKY
jgi:fructose-1,6-bisphosphatase II